MAVRNPLRLFDPFDLFDPPFVAGRRSSECDRVEEPPYTDRSTAAALWPIAVRFTLSAVRLFSRIGS